MWVLVSNINGVECILTNTIPWLGGIYAPVSTASNNIKTPDKCLNWSTKKEAMKYKREHNIRNFQPKRFME